MVSRYEKLSAKAKLIIAIVGVTLNITTVVISGVANYYKTQSAISEIRLQLTIEFTNMKSNIEANKRDIERLENLALHGGAQDEKP